MLANVTLPDYEATVAWAVAKVNSAFGYDVSITLVNGCNFAQKANVSNSDGLNVLPVIAETVLVGGKNPEIWGDEFFAKGFADAKEVIAFVVDNPLVYAKQPAGRSQDALADYVSLSGIEL